MHRARYRSRSKLVCDNKARDYFDLIHYDIWGGYRVKSLLGAQYFLTIVDDASRGVRVYLMNEKSEASQLLGVIMDMSSPLNL